LNEPIALVAAMAPRFPELTPAELLAAAQRVVKARHGRYINAKAKPLRAVRDP
jgi:hypothetical protein